MRLLTALARVVLGSRPGRPEDIVAWGDVHWGLEIGCREILRERQAIVEREAKRSLPDRLTAVNDLDLAGFHRRLSHLDRT